MYITGLCRYLNTFKEMEQQLSVPFTLYITKCNVLVILFYFSSFLFVNSASEINLRIYRSGLIVVQAIFIGYRILTSIMGIKSIPKTALNSIRWKIREENFIYIIS